MLNNVSVRDAIHINAFDLDDGTSRLDLHPCSSVCPSANDTGNNPVSLSKDIFDLYGEIRKRMEERSDMRAKGAPPVSGFSIIVVHVVETNALLGRGQIAKQLGIKPTNDSFCGIR